MLDDLLGRTPLRERIAELEADVERLRAQYEAESDRRAEAVTARQDAEERCNRLEDRIAQLEGELERARAGTASRRVRHHARLRGERLEEVLDRLESLRTGPEGAVTAAIVGELPAAVRDVLGDRAALVEDRAPCLLCLEDAGLVAVILEPPLQPSTEPVWSDRFTLEREWFRPAGRHALALVRADLFAVGVYDGRERLEYRGFESEVKGSHSKGGFSQARFERIREGQIDEHVERVVGELEAVAARPLYCVGQHELVQRVAAEVDVDATAAVDATGRPEAALEDAVRSFWTTDIRVV